MAEIRLGSPSAGVTVSDDLSGYVREGVRRAMGGALTVIERRIDGVHNAARMSWPVKTGRSRSDLDHGIAVTGDTADAFVRNRNSGGYAFFIKSGGQHAWTTYVRRPMEEGAASLARELGDDLVEKLSTGGAG